ncbi:WbqC family protein [Glaciecola siphonariae]|uniref:WbqC family protein n=1 Tax=Glaciecola siphonariae TaxID=521012 RepID=A0ABV9LXU3_9ALTE
MHQISSPDKPTSIGIVQPYLFPYLGYYQLVNHCDIFVFFDTVNFIKRGYVNRNNILLQGKEQRFTLPVQDASQNASIASLRYTNEYTKTLKTIAHAYAKAPYVNDVLDLVHSVMTNSNRSLASLNANSIQSVMSYLSIDKRFYFASDLTFDDSGSATDTLCNITKALDACIYCNPIGGRSLYTKEDFLAQGIELRFCQKQDISYSQNSKAFVDNLSMIDVLMWNSPEQVKMLLQAYTLS